ncbi:hypothetical protein NLN82_27635, partial [Citrobacter portucalensis]
MSFINRLFGGRSGRVAPESIGKHSQAAPIPVAQAAPSLGEKQDNARAVMVYKYVNSGGSERIPLIIGLRKHLNINLSPRGALQQTLAADLSSHKLWKYLDLLPTEIKKAYRLHVPTSDKSALLDDLAKAIIAYDKDLWKFMSPDVARKYKSAREKLDILVKKAHPSNSNLQQAVAYAINVIGDPQDLIKKVNIIEQQYNISYCPQSSAAAITNMSVNST